MGTCNARIGWAAKEFGYGAITCTQRVGLRSYASTDGVVRYCAIPGHERNVRRNHAEVVPVVVETPVSRESWTDAGWTEAELREAFGV